MQSNDTDEQQYDHENYGSFAARDQPIKSEELEYRREFEDDDEPVGLYEVNLLASLVAENESQSR